MGEAKRKKSQGQQLAEQVQQRIAAGEFGPRDAPRHYGVVLDKSARGAAALQALRVGSGLAGLDELLACDALRFWQASTLLPFAVLLGGSGPPERRVHLAADIARVSERLEPAASPARATSARGLVLALDDGAEAALQQALAKRRAA